MTGKGDSYGAELAVIRRRHPWRDTVEGILSAVILVLIIRHFTFEVFKIPTGSMAPTLLGQHVDLTCPNCGLEFPLDNGSTGRKPLSEARMGTRAVICPNCAYRFAPGDLAAVTCTDFPAAFRLPFPLYRLWPLTVFEDGERRLFNEGGNRVVVNKMFTTLKRWDVAVFWYPQAQLRCLLCGYNSFEAKRGDAPARIVGDQPICPRCHLPFVRTDRKAYIKRLIGLPGEEVSIRRGDIYINGKLARKPAQVQDAVWRLVYDSDYAPRKPQPSVTPRWIREAGGFLERKVPVEPASSGRERLTLRLTPDASGRAAVRYAPGIVDYACYNGHAPGDRLYDPVGDIRWDVQVRLDAPGTLRLAVMSGGIEYAARVAFGEGQGMTELIDGTQSLAASGFHAEPGKNHRIVVSNVDQSMELKVDGTTILAGDYNVEQANRPLSSGATLSVQGTGAEFEHVRLDRDLYYRPYDGPTKSFDGEAFSEEVVRSPERNYIMLGDNVRNSGDSREWGGVPEANLIGRAVVVWWPLDGLRPIH